MLIRQIGYIFLYIAGVFSPVMIVLLSHDEGHQHQHLEHPLVHEAAISFALIALMIFTFQVILAGRFKWVCNAFGLDSLIRFHRYAAVFATGLIIFHPVLLSIASNDWQLLIGLDISWHIWLGRAAREIA